MSDKETREITLKGIGASPGICIGKAYLVDKAGVDVVKKYAIHESDLEKEKNRFRIAVKKAKDDLHALVENSHEDFREHADILETHVALLKDKMLYGKTIETIEKEGVNAEWALRKVVSDLQTLFRRMPDAYLRERAADVVHVSDPIMRNLMGADPANVKDIDKRVILVAADLSPAETSQIQLERIMGFVTDLGGMTSHTGIIARTLEIPAVLGLDDVTRRVQNEDLLVVDGTRGEMVIHPVEDTLVRFVRRRMAYEVRKATIMRGGHFPAQTLDGVTVQVMGNIELPEEVVSVRDHGGDGIGLYRTEFQYLSRPLFPSESELFEKYRDVVEVMAPQPVTIRTLDINGDKAIARHSETTEKNPALGLRGIRYCLKEADVFKTQIRAILRAAAFGNVRILFPMVSTYDEILEAKRMLDEAAESLDREGAKFDRNVAIGMMIEVPSVAIMADIMAKEVDFFSIGTNDLIQYTLAIDRGNRHVSHLYQPLHPAIIRMLRQVSDAARENGVGVFICGEMAGEPIHAPVLLGLGMTELSMNPQSIPSVKRMVRSVNTEDAREMITDILREATAEGVRRVLQAACGDLMRDP